MLSAKTWTFRWDRFDGIVFLTCLASVAAFGLIAVLPQQVVGEFIAGLLLWLCAIGVPALDAGYRLLAPTRFTLTGAGIVIDFSGRSVFVEPEDVQALEPCLRGCRVERAAPQRDLYLRGAGRAAIAEMRAALASWERVVPKQAPATQPPPITRRPVPRSRRLPAEVAAPTLEPYAVPASALDEARAEPVDVWYGTEPASPEELARALYAAEPEPIPPHPLRFPIALLLTALAYGAYRFTPGGEEPLMVIGTVWVLCLTFALKSPPAAPQRVALLEDQVVVEYLRAAYRIRFDEILTVHPEPAKITLRLANGSHTIHGVGQEFYEALQGHFDARAR